MEVEGRHVNLHIGGRGPDVVLLHGLLGRPDYLLPLARSLARTRRVIVPALPGHAGSDRLCPFTFPAAAEQLRAAVALLGAESPALLAHSYGVPVAVWWAAAHPVASLVCVSPVGIARIPLERSLPLLRAAPTIGALARVAAPALARSRRGRQLVFGWFVGMAEPHAVDPSLGTRLIRGAASGRPALREMLPPLEHLDLTPVAELVSARSAVVWGSRDAHGPGNGLELAAALRGTAIELEGIGHMPMLEAPYAFRRAIDGFV